MSYSRSSSYICSGMDIFGTSYRPGFASLNPRDPQTNVDEDLDVIVLVVD